MRGPSMYEIEGPRCTSTCSAAGFPRPLGAGFHAAARAADPSRSRSPAPAPWRLLRGASAVPTARVGGRRARPSGRRGVAVARSARLVRLRGAAPWPADRSRRRVAPGLGTRPRCRSSGLPPTDRSACWSSGLAAPGPWSRLRGPARRARRGRSSIRGSARGTRGFGEQFRRGTSSTASPQAVHSLSSGKTGTVPSLSPVLCTKGALLERFRNCADTAFTDPCR